MAKRNRPHSHPRHFSQLSYDLLEQKQLLAGDVGVSIRAGNLIVTGDNLANTVSITSDDSGTATVQGTDTLVNGSENPFVFNGSIKNVFLRMANGNDQVSISGVTAERLLSLVSATFLL